MKHIIYYIILSLLISHGSSCSYSKRFTKNYYRENEALLQNIQKKYKQLYDEKPFALELNSKAQSQVALEIHTDSIKYIYRFRLEEPYLTDTLAKYQFDVKAMSELIDDMQKAHCTWITNLDYYERRNKKFLVFISVRHKKLDALLSSEKYFTLAFFDQPQPYDEKGRLLDVEDLKKNRLIIGAVFHRINDRVSYALTGKYRW